VADSSSGTDIPWLVLSSRVVRFQGLGYVVLTNSATQSLLTCSSSCLCICWQPQQQQQQQQQPHRFSGHFNANIEVQRLHSSR